MRLGGLILTGGHSRRMGRPKEWLPFGGDTLLGRTCAELCAAADPVAVVARDAAQPLPQLPTGVERIVDEQPGQGPLQALRSGLCWLRDRQGFRADDAAFVTACDLPFLDRHAVRWLTARLGGASMLMPVADGCAQPLTAIYRIATLLLIDELLASGIRSPRDLAGDPNCRLVLETELRGFDPTLRFLTNVNDPLQYSRANDASPPRTDDRR